jgi:hypothetical protein
VPSGYVQASLTRSLVAPPTTKISARFGMHAVDVGAAAGGYNSFASLVFEDAACATRTGGSRERRLALVFTTNGIHIAVIGFATDCIDAGEDFNTIGVTQLPVDKWYAIELVAARAPCPNQSGSSARVLIDDKEFVCVPLVIDPTTKTNGLALRLGSGIGAVWNATTLDFDDVAVIAEP